MGTGSRSARGSVWTFFAVTYAAAWLVWLPAILWQGKAPSLLFLVLGACVPSAVGTTLILTTGSRAERRDFWSRVVEVRRIGWRWLSVIVMFFPIAHLVAASVAHALGRSAPPLIDALRNLSDPGLVAQLVIANLIISGFSEELGWRGYALDRLQARWSPLVSSLILGFTHALWHLPLFFIPGITQGEMGLFSVGALAFFVGAVAGAISHTWIYNHTRRSILSAILVHFIANLCLDLLVGLQGAIPGDYFVVYSGTLVLFALFIAVSGGLQAPASLSGASPTVIRDTQRARGDLVSDYWMT